jgi:hypothetical protein
LIVAKPLKVQVRVSPDAIAVAIEPVIDVVPVTVILLVLLATSVLPCSTPAVTVSVPATVVVNVFAGFVYANNIEVPETFIPTLLNVIDCPATSEPTTFTPPV